MYLVYVSPLIFSWILTRQNNIREISWVLYLLYKVVFQKTSIKSRRLSFFNIFFFSLFKLIFFCFYFSFINSFFFIMSAFVTMGKYSNRHMCGELFRKNSLLSFQWKIKKIKFSFPLDKAANICIHMDVFVYLSICSLYCWHIKLLKAFPYMET